MTTNQVCIAAREWKKRCVELRGYCLKRGIVMAHDIQSGFWLYIGEEKRYVANINDVPMWADYLASHN